MNVSCLLKTSSWKQLLYKKRKYILFNFYIQVKTGFQHCLCYNSNMNLWQSSNYLQADNNSISQSYEITFMNCHLMIFFKVHKLFQCLYLIWCFPNCNDWGNYFQSLLNIIYLLSLYFKEMQSKESYKE